MQTRHFLTIAIAVFPVLAAACGSRPVTASAPSAGDAPAPTAAAAMPTGAPPASSSAIDIEAVNLCLLLPRAELASLAGGTAYEADDPLGPSCIYAIDPGDGSAALYTLNVSSPDLLLPMIDYVRQYEQAEWLEGIGDVAYLQPSALGDGFDMVVLVEGAYGLSLGGDDPQVLKAAALLIIERLAR